MIGRSFGNDPAYGLKQTKREAEDILEAVLGISEEVVFVNGP